MLDEDLVHLQFDSLTLYDFLFNSVLADQPVHVNLLLLADSVCPIHCLQVDLRVEIGVKQNDMVCGV